MTNNLAIRYELLDVLSDLRDEALSFDPNEKTLKELFDKAYELVGEIED